MIEILQSLWGYAQAGFEALENMIESLLTAIGILATVTVFPQAIMGYVPGIIGSSILLTVTIYVAKFIVGR